ncbi:MAG: VanW family protein [Candidatus Roizmanbacteria bacterium]|nr:VanW family protein [Candidatus Roizmanbacteria bacterium]
MRSILWFVACFLLGLTLVSISRMGYEWYQYQDRLYPNIVVDNVSVGGLPFDQARTVLTGIYEKNNAPEVVFTLDNDAIASLSAQQISYRIPVGNAIAEAMAIGRDPKKNMLQNALVSLRLILGMNEYHIALIPHYSHTAINEKLKDINEGYRTEPIDARFDFNNNRVETFSKETDGYELDVQTAYIAASNNLNSPEVKRGKKRIIQIPLTRQVLPAAVRLKDINNLGITELVASGSSHFAGSSAERIYNVTLGAQRLNGIIIEPNEVFSFVAALGEISRATGFKSAYVIKGGKTVLDDGGGICQVSTTLFRAALNTGLPIIERHAHSYRVGYYEQDSLPGFDATIYSPSVDLKFKNDYSSALLIQTHIDTGTLTLTMNIYGTRDNRVVSVGTPVVSNVIAAPPAEHIDDPSLPNGVVKQVDFAAPGGRSVFTYQVQKNGVVTFGETFTSDYRPWKAIFMHGVG